MGLGLNGCQIDATYPGLIKTCDNSAVTSTYKPITDGNGNDLPVQVSSLGTKFTGDADFTGATVTGLPDQDTTYTISSAQDATNAVINLDGSDASNSKVTLVAGTNITLTDDGSNNVTIDASGGAAGLVSGTGADSMQSDASLTTLPANASGTCSIALGDGACASAEGVSIGKNATATKGSSVVIGTGARNNNSSASIVIGAGAIASTLDQGMAIGISACNSTNAGGIAIGCNARNIGIVSDGMVIGRNSCNSGSSSGITIGHSSSSTAGQTIVIGNNSSSATGGTYSIGHSIVATRADALTTCEIELCAPGGGLYLTTPDGLAQPKLSVDNTSQLLVDGTPVGGGGAAGLVSGTGADSMQSAASLTTVAADASGACSIALGNGACAPGDDVIAIGKSAVSATGGINNIFIGNNTSAGLFQSNITVIGVGSTANGNQSTAVGSDVFVERCSFSGGNLSRAAGRCSVAVGKSACSSGQGSIALGYYACATALNAIAIGESVTAAKADTLTTREIELCTAGGGLYLTTPDGLAQPKLSVDNSQIVQIGSNAIPNNDAATNTVINKIWSGTSAQYTALGTYDANTLYYVQ